MTTDRERNPWRPILVLGALGFVALAFTVFTPGTRRGLAVLESDRQDVLRISGATVAYQGRGSVVTIAARRAELYWQHGEVRVRPKLADGLAIVETPHGRAEATGSLIAVVDGSHTRFSTEGSGLSATCSGTVFTKPTPPSTHDGALHCPSEP